MYGDTVLYFDTKFYTLYTTTPYLNEKYESSYYIPTMYCQKFSSPPYI